MAGARRRARPQHRHALAAVGRGDAARRPRGERARACPSCSTRSAPARPRYRTETAQRILDERRRRGRARQRGRGRDARRASRRRSAASSRSARPTSRAELARDGRASSSAASPSVTGPVDHVSDGDAVARGRERPRAARDGHRHGLHVDRAHRLLPRRRRRAARGRGRGAGGVRRRGRGCGARAQPGPGTFHVAPVRRARRARPGDARRRARIATREAARARRGPRDGAPAVEGGATVVQLRLKGAADAEVVERGRPFASCARPASRSSSTTTSRRRSRSAPTACTSAATTQGNERARERGPAARALGVERRGGA